MSEQVIRIKNLYKTFGELTAVNSLDFEVTKNKCYGLLGPNGAGKTTTMKIIYGKALPDNLKETQINVFGLNPLHNPLEIRSFSGVVPQQDNLDLELNAWENLMTYARFYGIPKTDATKRISQLLEFMELSEKAQANVRHLSGGMQRRLVIARALLNNPKLLFLDEPTTGLDPQVRHLIWNKLRELKKQGVTLLLTTHYMEEAYQICDEIIIMDKGNKILSGNPRKLLDENLEKYVLEIYGVDPKNNPHENQLKKHNVRYEYFNGVLYAYSNESEKLSSLIHSEDTTKILIRPANLEDLFLKVTGRRLNELQ